MKKKTMRARSEVWITVATFEQHADAALAKSLLEAAAIQCWLRDETVVAVMPWHGLGGIKLQVAPEDRDAAIAVLQSKRLAESEPFGTNE